MKITFIKTGKRVKTKEDRDKDSKKKEVVKEKVNAIKNKTNNGVNQNKDRTKNDANKTEILKTVFRKNQVVLLTLALMLVTAGYMNYNNSNNELNISLADVGDAQLVSANITDENVIANENEIETEHEVSSNAVENEVTNSSSQDYYTQTRLERQTMYSQMLEAYQKILENEKIPADQKSIAANEIKNINDRINAISIIENLIKTKGFEDVIILINDNNINVVVKQDNNLSQEQVAQITNIVSRELKSEIEDIHITVQK